MKEALPRIAYRPREVAVMTGLSEDFVRHAANDGRIPRMAGTGKAVCIPAWALDAWQRTGDWHDRPQPQPTNSEGPAARTTEPSTQTENGPRS